MTTPHSVILNANEQFTALVKFFTQFQESCTNGDLLYTDRLPIELSRLKDEVLLKFGGTIKDSSTLPEFETNPSAWRVFCPPGHEFDFMVFHDQEHAEIRADEFNDDLPEGQTLYNAEPLYARRPAEAAKKE